MNFVYSFNIQKPKNIFLVHGEEEAENTLKEKIEQEAKIPVTIAEYGQTYELSQMPELVSTIVHNKPRTIKTEIIEKLNILESQIDDMKQSVQEDLNNNELRDEDLFRIKEKMKELEYDILSIIEG